LKKILLFIATISILFCSCATHDNTMYGNNMSDVEKILNSQENNNKNISVFDMVDVEKNRFVGFFQGDSQIGYAVFLLNNDGNYVFDNIKYLNSLNNPIDNKIYCDSYSISDKNEKEHYENKSFIDNKYIEFDIIISNNSELAMIKRQVTNVYIDTTEVTHNPSLSVIKCPGTYSNTTSFQFLDKNGEPV